MKINTFKSSVALRIHEVDKANSLWGTEKKLLIEKNINLQLVKYIKSNLDYKAIKPKDLTSGDFDFISAKGEYKIKVLKMDLIKTNFLGPADIEVLRNDLIYPKISQMTDDEFGEYDKRVSNWESFENLYNDISIKKRRDRLIKMCKEKDLRNIQFNKKLRNIQFNKKLLLEKRWNYV